MVVLRRDTVNGIISQMIRLLIWIRLVVRLAYCAPIPSDPQAQDRNNTFQILADGTQDLAALVALFATDSVERYVIDYPQGSISVAMASCSMLGLLGHVRALLKLGLGPEACENAAFPTAAIRPILGVAKRDRIAASELRTIYYLRYGPCVDAIQWSLVKRIRHTDESMPWISHVPYDRGTRLQLRHFWKNPTVDRLGNLRSWPSLLYHCVVQGAAAAATAFAILAFSHEKSPTRYFATLGLFFAVLISSVMWAWYYGQESLAPENRIDDNARCNLAFFYEDEGACFYHANAVYGPHQTVVMFTSLFLAVIAAGAYVCQYIEVRKISATGAALWLVVQGGLALLRVLYWIMQPYLGRSHRVKKYRSQSRDVVLNEHIKEIEIIANWCSTVTDPVSDYITTLRIPPAISDGFIKSSLEPHTVGKINIKHAFKLWRHSFHDSDCEEVQQVLRGGEWWEMPPHTFNNWLDMRLQEMTDEGDYESGCHIIKYKNKFHMWPGLYYVYGSEDNTKWRAFITFSSINPYRSLFAVQELQSGRWVHSNAFNYPSTKGKGRIGNLASLMPDLKERNEFMREQPRVQQGKAWSLIDEEEIKDFRQHFDRLRKRVEKLDLRLGVLQDEDEEERQHKTAGLR